MVALVRTALLDLSDEGPAEARKAIREELAGDPRATRRVYAALARKVWSLLVERRFDPEIRDWHVLLEGVKAKVRSTDHAAAERVTALADLVRESINLSEMSPAKEVAERPRARAILEQLATADRFTKRRLLLEKLGIGSSHLSNILTELIAHDLIERKGNGKEAEFRITRAGRAAIGLEDVAQVATTPAEPDLHFLFTPSSPVLSQPASGLDQLIYPVHMKEFHAALKVTFDDVASPVVPAGIEAGVALGIWPRHSKGHHLLPWKP